jgi:hypothetical protein
LTPVVGKPTEELRGIHVGGVLLEADGVPTVEVLVRRVETLDGEPLGCRVLRCVGHGLLPS